MSIKISIIGAGSGIFSLSLIKDICLTPNLRGSIISLMDVSEQRLNDVYGLCTRYAEEVGIELQIEKTTDRRTCLLGADFVIDTALVASHDRLQEGWKIAFRHGYHFGGSLHIMHDEAFWVNFYQLALMESIAKDILEICPKAWFILVANPVLAGITYISRKYPQINIVGMCHGFAGVYRIAEVLGLRRDDIEFEIPGVNHFVWLNSFKFEGEDAFPLLDRWIAKRSSSYFRGCGICDPMGPKAVDLYRRFEVFPIGDTGNPGGGAWGYWYHKDKQTELKWQEDPLSWYMRYFKEGLDNVKEIARVVEEPGIKVTEAFRRELSGEPVVPLIEALACDVERMVIVNVLNDDKFVHGIPSTFAVEVPAMINARGIKGKKTERLPDSIVQFTLRDRVVPVELELKAFETGHLDLLLDLILMDPWTVDGEQADRFLEDILKLPYHKEMRNHFR